MTRLLRLLPCLVILPGAAFAAKADKKTDKTPAAAFTAMDSDKNGTVSLEEYVAAQRERLGEDGAKKHFAELDKNSDGKLTKEEFGAGENGDKKKTGKKANKKKDKVE